MIDVFIPSYHRADNLKTVRYLEKIDYDMQHVYVFVDDEADDRERYKAVAKQYGFHLVVFDMTRHERGSTMCIERAYPDGVLGRLVICFRTMRRKRASSSMW